jgi:hypothetical protein
MAIYLNAEARCSHCGTRAPCELKILLWGGKAFGSREYSGMSAAVHGIETWFRKDDGLACSAACRDVLAKDPRFANFGGQWHPCR